MIANFDPNGEFSRKSCFEYRIGIEGEAAALAARNRSPTMLKLLAEAMETLEEAKRTGDPGLEKDFAFHLLVARASGNDYFVSALRSLKDEIFAGMLLARTVSGLNGTEKLTAINEQHRNIYNAILLGDEAMARASMREHLIRCKLSTKHWDVLA